MKIMPSLIMKFVVLLGMASLFLFADSAGASVTPMLFGGYNYTLSLKSDGTVWAWGNNVYGKLGNNSTTSSLTPVQAGIDGVSAIATGCFHTVALKSDGTVWAWGYNGSGQLGDGSTMDSLIPVHAIGHTQRGQVSTINRTM